MTGITLILGHPRSGTSFLHRFMLEHYSGLTGKRLEDMLFIDGWPRILKPLKKIARALPLNWLYRPGIHRTGMRCWECDDIAFSIHHKAGYLSWLYGQCRSTPRFSSQNFDAWVSENGELILKCWDRLHQDELSIAANTSILSKSVTVQAHSGL